VTGLVVLIAILVVTTAFGVWRARTGGRLAIPRGQVTRAALSPDDIGHDLGERATLVQFSSAFCAPCRATRQVLAHVARSEEGVRHIEIDAESHLDLVRRLGITRTPTTFVLDHDGGVVRRSTGVPRLAEVVGLLSGMATR
jgi:thiol-disulfide isomerase/thioredoxin